MILTADTASRYRAALRAGAHDLFLVPVFLGTQHWLKYVDGVLDKSSVPDTPVKPVRNLRGLPVLEHEPVLHVRCTFFKDAYYAMEVRVDEGGEEDHAPITRILQFHLLASRSVPTPLSLCSWATVCGAKSDGTPKTRALPADRKAAEALMQQRVKELNEVRLGKRPAYWQGSTLFSRKAALRFPRITSLEIAEATGVEYDAPGNVLPRLW